MYEFFDLEEDGSLKLPHKFRFHWELSYDMKLAKQMLVKKFNDKGFTTNIPEIEGCFFASNGFRCFNIDFGEVMFNIPAVFIREKRPDCTDVGGILFHNVSVKWLVKEILEWLENLKDKNDDHEV